MSGGSCGYVYSKELTEGRWGIRRIAERLRELGHAKAAAAVEHIEKLMDQVDENQETLRDLLHDVEWQISADYDASQVAETVKRMGLED